MSPLKYLFCISLAVIALVGGILFSGLNDMYAFGKVALKDDYSLADVRFFTLQHLRREAVRLTAGRLREQSSLPSFQFYVSEKSLASLNDNLPDSGKKRYIQAHLKVDSPGLTSQVKIRYRGNIPLHWLHHKKSLRVSLPEFSNYLGLRKFNLVNPSTLPTITDWISYDMSRELGLLTPDYFPARVFFNNQYNGLHFFLGQADESLLRKLRRMPGSIYSGDNYALENPFGENLGINTRVFVDDKSESLMWTDYRLWDKIAHRNVESVQDRRDIKKFVSIINTRNPLEFMRDFTTYFDTDKYYKFWSLDTVVGSYHHDLYHNQKMYFDPYLGRFEPIQWDVRFWSEREQPPITPLLRQVKLNPVLSYRLDQSTFNLLEKFSVEEIHDRITGSDRRINPELDADPYRQHPSNDNKFENIQTIVPFFMPEYAGAIERLKSTYSNQHRRIYDQLNSAAAAYTVEKIGAHTVRLTLAVSGNSPLEFSPWQLFPHDMQEKIKVYRRVEGRAIAQRTAPATTIIYPGRKVVPGIPREQDAEWARVAFGESRLVNSPLHYRYEIIGGDGLDLSIPEKLSLRNAVTGGTVLVSETAELEPDVDTDSVHPWRLRPEDSSHGRMVKLSGSIDVDADLVFLEDQTVTIAPGTTFHLASSASVVFYGKVLAEGTLGNTIKFRQKVPGEYWGSLILKGKAASGSRLTHIDLSGGSISTQRLVDYPGQINIHEVEDFELRHCAISNNQQGDDALHVAYSSGTISHCHFENTAFDAVDMDLVDVSISDSSFLDIGNDAIDLMSSVARIDRIEVRNAGDKCLSIGENSTTELSNSELENCLVGIAVKDQSTADLDNVSFRGNRETAIALYRKNPHYSSGGSISGKALSGISLQDIQIGDNSVNNISAEEFSPAVKSASR